MGVQHVEVRGVVTTHLNITRMNPSNLYEQYFSAMSRRIKKLTMDEVDKYGGPEVISDQDVAKIYPIVLEGVKAFGTEQYDSYLQANIEEQLEIVKEVYYKECYIYYKVSSKKKPYEVIEDVKGTIYEPIKARFKINGDSSGENDWSKSKLLIAPQYIILLAKTPESYLATSSAKTNHYDLPVSVGPKIRQNIPYRNSPVKILSETETRLYGAYVSRKGLAEMKDRANSVTSHRLVYEKILSSDRPTDIDALIDRNEHPFGTDKSLEIVESILNASGIDLEYVPERNK